MVSWLARIGRFFSPLAKNTIADQALLLGLPLLTVFVFYVGIFKEVEIFWNQRYASSAIAIRSGADDVYQIFNEHLLSFKSLWLIFYSAIFALALSFFQIKFAQNRHLMLLSLGINVLVMVSFLTNGLYHLAVLREGYLHDIDNPYYIRDFSYVLIRYLGLTLTAPLVVISYRYFNDGYFNHGARQTAQVLFHVAMLVVLSSELIHWLDIARVENSFKLGLSILWGCYALLLIVWGLWNNLRHIRVMAIVLFGLTLLKLFVYDMAGMSTIYRTIVMIILGVLLLIASFLYNKYKQSAGNEIQ